MNTMDPRDMTPRQIAEALGLEWPCDVYVQGHGAGHVEYDHQWSSPADFARLVEERKRGRDQEQLERLAPMLAEDIRDARQRIAEGSMSEVIAYDVHQPLSNAKLLQRIGHLVVRGVQVPDDIRRNGPVLGTGTEHAGMANLRDAEARLAEQAKPRELPFMEWQTRCFQKDVAELSKRITANPSDPLFDQSIRSSESITTDDLIHRVAFRAAFICSPESQAIKQAKNDPELLAADIREFQNVIDRQKISHRFDRGTESNKLSYIGLAERIARLIAEGVRPNWEAKTAGTQDDQPLTVAEVVDNSTRCRKPTLVGICGTIFVNGIPMTLPELTAIVRGGAK